MSANVLLNFIKRVGEKDQMRGCAEHLISFHNEFKVKKYKKMSRATLNIGYQNF